jgi:hypothetical protein
MFRVVTTTIICCERGRMRQIDLGPWLPTDAEARKWAAYLERTCLYDTVSLQTNGHTGAPHAFNEEIISA